MITRSVHPRTNTTILIVEDDPDCSFIIRLWLEHAGYRVIVACDGMQAIAAAKSDPPDLILMDLALPQMDGFDAAKCIREYRPTRGVPIVALTALALPDSGARARSVGVDGYLPKPARLAEILETVEAFVGRPDRDVAAASRGF